RDVRAVEGARLESVCTGNCTEGSNPSLSAIFISNGGTRVSCFCFQCRTAAIPAGSYAMETHEPRQVRKEAAVSDNFYVP
ncbi:MAG: hypothetical protein H6Q65_2500, partial [Firmicutes bacterium]|nr:hypothetical protein [Bacillota bacterium]